MAKYELTESQQQLIRRGLEQLYYISKDEGDRDTMNAVTQLEESLIKQQKELDKEYQNMLNQIHDCYYDCMDEKPTDEQVKEISVEIKKELEYEAEQWGWDDTEVADRIWNWINENIKHG